VPKSSSCSGAPRPRSACNVRRVSGSPSSRTDSVISNATAPGAMSSRASMPPATSTRSGSRSWRRERLTDTPGASSPNRSRQIACWRHAAPSTWRPSSTICLGLLGSGYELHGGDPAEASVLPAQAAPRRARRDPCGGRRSAGRRRGSRRARWRRAACAPREHARWRRRGVAGLASSDAPRPRRLAGTSPCRPRAAAPRRPR